MERFVSAVILKIVLRRDHVAQVEHLRYLLMAPLDVTSLMKEPQNVPKHLTHPAGPERSTRWQAAREVALKRPVVAIMSVRQRTARVSANLP